MVDSPAARPVVGVAGCGTMGLPMAQSLERAGYEVLGLDVRPSAEFGSFAPSMCPDPREFAARAEVVISVVRDAKQTLDLCFDQQALFAGEHGIATLVVSSTLSPRFLPELRARLPDNTSLVDAPMSGAPHAARAGALSFMVGGAHEDLERLAPLFDVMGDHTFRLGPLGAGMTAKVLNNYVACITAMAVRRTYDRADALGMDLEQLRAVMHASSGQTWFGDNFHSIDWARQGYAPENTIGILEKDVRSGLDAVSDLGAVGPDAFDAAVLDAIRGIGPWRPGDTDD
ncbi:MAG: NAD(P)-dependent oxidoreductase [Pseudomonadota bacterium]